MAGVEDGEDGLEKFVRPENMKAIKDWIDCSRRTQQFFCGHRCDG